MPKTTTFNPEYGYIRHPEDRDHICFWCGRAVTTNTWDYTPHRHIGKHAELMAQINTQPYAVQACTHCINRTAYRKMELTTIEKKRLYFSIANKKAALELLNMQAQIESKWHAWQVKLPTGELVDRPESELSEFVLECKRQHYKTAVQGQSSNSSGAEIDDNPDIAHEIDPLSAETDEPSAVVATGDVHHTVSDDDDDFLGLKS